MAGLLAAHALARKKVACILIERKSYPFHRVCGEYISEEVTPYLESLRLFPHQFNPPRIRQLQLTSVNGKEARLPLNTGGFGISRYTFDQFLVDHLPQDWVSIKQNCEVTQIDFTGQDFVVATSRGDFKADVVIGAYGKRSRLDSTMKRDFMQSKSPYVGVKYHVRTSHPNNVISLHNFKDGYCGISNIEEGKSNLCYLTHRHNFKIYKTIPEIEENILCRNPYLKSIFRDAEFLSEKPEVINEISFASKRPVENHVLMCGDSAGMITPLCGNGMAMAIHASKLISDLVYDFHSGKISRQSMEGHYYQLWTKHFAKRLWAGRKIQSLFGSEFASDLAVQLARHFKPVANYLVTKTHGQPF